jgi:hypothetical protein
MNTVNVIEITDTNSMNINRLVCFPDNKEGNVDAEKLFKKIIKKGYKTITSEDIHYALDDGYFSRHNYYVAIVHSTN